MEGSLRRSSPARRLAGEAGGEPPSDNRSGLPPIIREEWVDNNNNIPIGHYKPIEQHPLVLVYHPPLRCFTVDHYALTSHPLGHQPKTTIRLNLNIVMSNHPNHHYPPFSKAKMLPCTTTPHIHGSLLRFLMCYPPPGRTNFLLITEGNIVEIGVIFEIYHPTITNVLPTDQ